MSLMDQIRATHVEQGSAAVWWLGQNGYIFKSPEGLVAGVDLYLTDACGELYADSGLNLHRTVPVLIQPEELDVDLFVCTHNHADHTDVYTLRRLAHRHTMRFIGPHPSCDVFRAEGIPDAAISPAWPDCALRHADLTLRGTFALPTDDTDLNHMGFVFEFAGGPKIYMTGDTDYHDLVASAAKHRPDVMIACINGGFNNLSTWEAAELAARVKPRIAVPCHYDLFPDNAVDPKQFRACLKVRAPEVSYHELTPGVAWIVR
jgi:L-ascorbate 6-phosphate lactonase